MTLDHWAQFAPSLSLYARLIDDLDDLGVIAGWGSSPQPQAKDFDPNEEESLSICIDDGHTVDNWFSIYKDRVTYYDDDGEHQTTFAALIKYILQLPRPISAF